VTVTLVSTRLERLRRLRTRLREQAAGDLAAGTVALATAEEALATTRRATDAARAVAATATTGADLAVAWGWGDALARRDALLAAERVRALAAAEATRARLRARRRDEEQLARLGARALGRRDREIDRAAAAVADALALWLYGRTR
jgi:hypothetical protein